ncbi:helix-turn-helix domain-containing protein [Umezawaea sp.]|uniref:winged helix-turn-helix transcriptional regulator n=1 Tax=Umezawaea sp. TaxID=1955258 RepID=UPI002ED3B36A
MHDLPQRFEADSVGRALALVGERWTLLILREAFFGVRRFGELSRNLGIPKPTLSARLRTLVDAGLLDRVPHGDHHEYRLTDRGRDLFPAVVALMRWGDEHLGGPSIALRHHACGEVVRARVVCGHCTGEITTDSVTPEAVVGSTGGD